MDAGAASHGTQGALEWGPFLIPGSGTGGISQAAVLQSQDIPQSCVCSKLFRLGGTSGMFWVLLLLPNCS